MIEDLCSVSLLTITCVAMRLETKGKSLEWKQEVLAGANMDHPMWLRFSHCCALLKVVFFVCVCVCDKSRSIYVAVGVIVACCHCSDLQDPYNMPWILGPFSYI